MHSVAQAIAISDLHLHYWEHYNDQGARTKNAIEFLEKVFLEAQTGNIPILFGGDLFHTPEGLKSPTINTVYPELTRLFYTYPDVQFYAISGNHDQYTRNYLHKPSISYTAGLANTFKNFHLIDMAGVVLDHNVGVYGIPYLYLNQNFAEAIDRAKLWFKSAGVSKSILIIHTTLEGSIDTNGYKLSESSVLVEILEKHFTLVLSGHIHRHQKIAKGIYHIGSPTHVKASDAGYKPVYLKISNKLVRPGLTVKVTDVPKPMVFKYYSEPTERDNNPLHMWVYKSDKAATGETPELLSNDLSDFPQLLRTYLDLLEVKSPLRRHLAINTLNQVLDNDKTN